MMEEKNEIIQGWNFSSKIASSSIATQVGADYVGRVKIRIRRNRKKWVIVGNLGAQKEKRNDTPISAKKDIMGDKTVRVRADLHHIIKIETAKNGGNVKEVMEIRLRSKLKSVLIVHYLKILYNRNWS